jgi:hypothetical protein
MLTLRQDQMVAMAASYRQGFLLRLTSHLDEMASRLFPGERHSFSDRRTQRRLSDELSYLTAHGIRDEQAAASMIELFELFGVEFGDPRVCRIIETDMVIQQKLERLWEFRVKEKWTSNTL